MSEKELISRKLSCVTEKGVDVPIPDDAGFSLLKAVIKAFKVAGIGAGVWIWGYFGFSVAWVYVGLFFYVASEECRKIKESKKSYARHAMCSEKEAVVSRVDELPSWVYFPDYEKAEWFNKVLKQMWPFIGEYVQNLMMTSIQQTIQYSLPQNFNNFRFETIDMGDKPPRIDGVKVYTEQVQKDEIILDVQMRYNGDAKFKISVNGVNAGIKGVEVSGMMRVIMKPLVDDVPIIGALSVFFLSRPTVTFDLTDAATILDMPLLKKSLRASVEDQISRYLVLPHRLPIQLVSSVDISKLKHPMPQGVVHVNVIAARDLKAADSKTFNIGVMGTCDPYCIVRVGAQEYRTKTVRKSMSPEWDYHCEIIIDQKFGQEIELELRDEDISNDELLGVTKLNVETIAKTGSVVDFWQKVKGTANGKVHLKTMWFHLSKDVNELKSRRSMVTQKQVNGSKSLSTAVLVLLLKEAKLPGDRNTFAQIKVGEKTFDSSIQPKSANPVWDENFHFLVDDPENRQVFIELFYAGTTKKKFGAANIPIKDLLSADKMTAVKTVPVTGTTDIGLECTVTVKLSLRILSSDLPIDWYTDSSLLLSSFGDDNSPPVSDDSTSSPPVANGVKSGGDAEQLSSGIVPRPVVEKTQAPTKSAPLSENPSQFGQIQLTIKYNAEHNVLNVTVHQCRNLIPRDKNDNLADPYVRIYVLPDHTNVTKKRTKMVKNSLNPTFDETFEWKMTVAELAVRSLEVAVRNDVSIFSKSRTEMGMVVISLSTARDLTKATQTWYDLTGVL